MKDVIYLLFDLLTIIAGLLRHGGSRAVIASDDCKVVDIQSYRWKTQCRGLFQLPAAA